MDILEIILIVLMGLALGVAVGMAIALHCMEKPTRDLIDSYKRAMAIQQNIMDCDDKIHDLQRDLINNNRRFIQVVYSELVRLRDAGTENLDELISEVGEYMEETKED